MLLVDGLPLHPLIVHAVVVLLPLAALGALAMAVRPAWRRRYGILVLLLSIAGVAAVPFATVSGSQLQGALPSANPLIEIHAERGEFLLPAAGAFLVLVAVAVTVGKLSDPSGRHAGRRAGIGSRVAAVVSVLAGLAGLGVTALVVWIGHSGASAVWQGVGG